MKVYSTILAKKQQGKKQIAILVDPDKHRVADFSTMALRFKDLPIDYLFVGGSLLSKDLLDACLTAFKSITSIPLVIFPGSVMQVNSKADAILLLSLVSGRNADLLIGRHVEAVPYLKQAQIETLSTAYLLIDGGKITTAQYISGTLPIPADKPEIASLTAQAAEMIGHKLVYLDAGSGAISQVPDKMIQQVKKDIQVPLFVGGGIRTPEQAKAKLAAGADLLVIGNVLEQQPEILQKMVDAVKQFE
ncbi:MAG: geranylgeranylglyceryl/heptaprenylglyceryl phosphate synthase [Bacteroidales bacterium]|nr:geranylgeranylglyceryl/heptaprenylglyceryl phosphate synthase [Bacteroidales bacterium]